MCGPEGSCLLDTPPVGDARVPGFPRRGRAPIARVHHAWLVAVGSGDDRERTRLAHAGGGRTSRDEGTIREHATGALTRTSDLVRDPLLSDRFVAAGRSVEAALDLWEVVGECDRL